MSNANCLSCQRYLACNDPEKGRLHICTDFRQRNLSDSVLLGRLTDIQGISGSTNGDDAELEMLALAEIRRKEEEASKRELSLASVVDEILSSESVIPRDFKIDDSDLPDFKNIYDFVFNETYRFGLPLWPRQMWMGVQLFADWCPRCSHPGCRVPIPHPAYDDTEHIIPVAGDGKDILEFVQLLEHGVCPKCGATRSEMWAEGSLNVYNELAAVIGQRSGKSTCTAIFDAYLTARVLKLQKPTQVYPGMARNTVLTGTMVALRFQDAEELLWNPFRMTLDGSEWFQEYHKLMRDYNNKLGKEFFRELETSITYGHRNLLIHPSGPNKRTLRGRTRIFANIDEYGWFDSRAESDSKERTSAKEVYGALDVSLTTVRNAARVLLERGYNNIPTAMAMNISSPSSEDDAIMELVKTNKTSRTILAVHLPTWSVNPFLTREALQPDFDKDYATAMRNLGVIPPESAMPFIGPNEPLEQAFGKFPNGVQYRRIHGHDPQGRLRTALELTMLGQSQDPHVMAIDAGQTKNSFSLVLGTINPKVPMNQGRMRFPVMVECIPKRESPISFTQMKIQVLSRLIRAYNVVGVVADRWQSIMLLDELAEEFKPGPHRRTGLFTQIYSVKYRDFMDFKSYVLDGGAWFPHLETENPYAVDMTKYPDCLDGSPAHHLFFQCRRSVDRGIVVEKGPKVTDDLLRAAVLASHFMLDDKWTAKWMVPAQNNVGSGRAVGGVIGRGGGVLIRGQGVGNGNPSGRRGILIAGRNR